MPRTQLGKLVRYEVLAGFVLLLVACALAVLASIGTRHASSLVSQSLRIRQSMTELFGELRDTETRQRSYLLTGDSDYLQTYRENRQRLAARLAQLRELIANEANQRQLLDQLDAAVNQKITQLEHAITLHDAGQPTAAIDFIKSSRDAHTVRTIRTLIAQLEQNEMREEIIRLDHARHQQELLLVAIISTTLLAFFLAVLVMREEARQRHELAFKNAVLEEQIRRQRTTEDRLRQGQKMEALGQLTGGIAHDFNNMLAIVVGNLEMALRRLDRGMEGVDHFIRNALTGAGKAADLTKGLLAFSRRQALRPVSIDINTCVQQMSSILHRTLGENIVIKLVLGEGMWNAYVDRPHLESALLNLAINSRDAMEGHGQLTIETGNAYLDQSYANQNQGVTEGEYVMIAVSDTGHGMTPEVLKQVFEPFFTTKPTGHGTGLGLSQIHGFLTQSRGHISIHSEVGIGTTVKLYLPRSNTASAPAQQQNGHQVSCLPHAVLVVEDDTDVRAFVCGALEDLGYTAFEAGDAGNAEAILAKHPEISILLSDVVMPGPSGVQLAEAMIKRYPDLRVLLMSGYARDIVERATATDHRIRLLSKPFTIQELAECLKATLNEEREDTKRAMLARDAEDARR
jgi:signal transduction histidine kinase/ActR/RegA family two-component response regulator